MRHAHCLIMGHAAACTCRVAVALLSRPRSLLSMSRKRSRNRPATGHSGRFSTLTVSAGITPKNCQELAAKFNSMLMGNIACVVRPARARPVRAPCRMRSSQTLASKSVSAFRTLMLPSLHHASPVG